MPNVSNILTTVEQLTTGVLAPPSINNGQLKIIANTDATLPLRAHKTSDVFLLSLKINKFEFTAAPLFPNPYSTLLLSINDSPDITRVFGSYETGSIYNIDGYMNHANGPFPTAKVFDPFIYNGQIKILKPAAYMTFWAFNAEGAVVNYAGANITVNYTLSYIRI